MSRRIRGEFVTGEFITIEYEKIKLDIPSESSYKGVKFWLQAESGMESWI
jgi:hypothetical protein